MSKSLGLTQYGGLQLTGTVVEILPMTEQNGFKKRIMWLAIDEDESYPQTVAIEFPGDKVSLLDGLGEGQTVTVDINLRGKVFERDGKRMCFTSLGGWRIAADGGAPKSVRNSQPAVTSAAAAPQPDGGDDLPF